MKTPHRISGLKANPRLAVRRAGTICEKSRARYSFAGDTLLTKYLVPAAQVMRQRNVGD